MLLGVTCLLVKPRKPDGTGRRNEPGPRIEPDGRNGPRSPRLVVLESTETAPRLVVLESAESTENARHLVVLNPSETAELQHNNSLAIDQPQPERVETIEPPIEFHLCLLSSPDWGAGIRRLSAVAGSVLAHAALVAAVMDASGGKAPNAQPKYRLQVLHLQQPTPSEIAAAAAAEELWNTLHHPLQSSGKPSADGTRFARASFGTGPRRKSRAPQTLIVENAPPDLKLNQAIPLPMAVSWTALQPLPPKQEQVRLDSPQAPALQTIRVPEVKIISVPDPAQQAPNAVVIPKVNQSAAAQDSPGRNSKVAEAHDATADAAAEEAARARELLDENRGRAEEAAKIRAQWSKRLRSAQQRKRRPKSAPPFQAGPQFRPAPACHLFSRLPHSLVPKIKALQSLRSLRK